MSYSDGAELKNLGEELHQQLLDGDVTASARISELFLPLVVSKLNSKYPNLYDPHLAGEAAIDAIMNYLRKPSQFLPHMKRLDSFLMMVAERDLLNLLQKEKNAGLPKKLEVVELNGSDGEYIVDDGENNLSVEEQVILLTSPLWTTLELVLPDETDRKILKLMMDGERSSLEFASELGIANTPPEHQSSEVKRHKDRIKKTIQRHLPHSELDEK
jgi:hypothetical protein